MSQARASETAAAEPIKVVHLLHTVAYGGVETVLVNWIRGLDRSRFEPKVVCFANPGGTEEPFVEVAERHGIGIAKIPWSRRKPLFKSARALAALLRREGAQILHTHNWYADMVGALAGRLAPVKTITTLYVWFDYDWKRNLLQRIDQYAIRAFDRITAHCEQTRQATVARGIPEDRVQTLIAGFEAHPVALDPGERSRRRRALGVSDDDVLLVNVARLYPEKIHDFLLRSFDRIRQRCPRARLWIAGVGPLEEELRSLCTRLGLDDAVRWVGFVDELPEFLALADLQVHPAAVEGVPIALCSGMAAELPIVASAVGGIPEIIRHEETGILTAPGDAAAFEDATLRLIEEPSSGRELGRRARHFIENDYSLDAAVARLERTYLELLGRCA